MVWLTGSEKTLGFTEICANRIVNNEMLKKIYKTLNCKLKNF